MNKKVKFLSVAASMALAASLGTPALAAGPGVVPVTGGTDVYAGVTDSATTRDTNLKVTVPTLFSFVVVGTADGSTGISVDNNNLLLPNVQVAADGEVSTVGQSQLYFTNYSTYVNGMTYRGQPVNVTGAVVADNSSAWTYNPEPTAHHQYGLTLAKSGEMGVAFDTPQADGSYACATGISLAAPNVSDSNDVDEDNTALVGATQAVSIGVNVGGNDGDYSDVAASAKVGTIVWTITAE